MSISSFIWGKVEEELNVPRLSHICPMKKYRDKKALQDTKHRMFTGCFYLIAVNVFTTKNHADIKRRSVETSPVYTLTWLPYSHLLLVVEQRGRVSCYTRLYTFLKGTVLRDFQYVSLFFF
jgi:hypothetical protein